MMPKEYRRFAGWLLAPAGALFIPFYAAMALLVAISFLNYSALNGGSVVLTLANFTTAIADPYNFGVLVRTLVLSMLVSAICVGLGVPLSWGIARTRSSGLRLVLSFVVLMPFMLNALVRLFAWTTILSREGLINLVLVWLGLVDRPRSLLRSDIAVLLGQVYFLLPFAVLTLTVALSKLPRTVEGAAQSLGAGPWATFFKVVLPLLRPSMLSGGIIVYSLSVSAFVVPLILGGDQYKMYANLIYDQVTFSGDYGLAAAMALILLACSIGLIAIYRLVLHTPAQIGTVR